MARPAEPEIRHKILETCAKQAMESGLHGLSLKTLSKKVQVSSRMLIYHFGSAENLLEQTLLEVQRSLRYQLHGSLLKQAGTHRDVRQLILKIWKHGIARRMDPFFRSYFHLCAESLNSPKRHSVFVETSIRGWVSWLGENVKGHQPSVRESDLTLIMGTLRGLFLDYWATKEGKRTTEALKSFLTHFQFE